MSQITTAEVETHDVAEMEGLRFPDIHQTTSAGDARSAAPLIILEMNCVENAGRVHASRGMMQEKIATIFLPAGVVLLVGQLGMRNILMTG
mmetsp:Transcript_8796/g.12982  ORF Transcript_8796/g.12982 Transcript_8796/m.12982 type:complete len:91 (-) Transcript_8796:1572-1844(-)